MPVFKSCHVHHADPAHSMPSAMQQHFFIKEDPGFCVHDPAVGCSSSSSIRTDLSLAMHHLKGACCMVMAAGVLPAFQPVYTNRSSCGVSWGIEDLPTDQEWRNGWYQPVVHTNCTAWLPYGSWLLLEAFGPSKHHIPRHGKTGRMQLQAVLWREVFEGHLRHDSLIPGDPCSALCSICGIWNDQAR